MSDDFSTLATLRKTTSLVATHVRERSLSQNELVRETGFPDVSDNSEDADVKHGSL